MARTIKVTRAQVLAAQALVERAQHEGKPVSAAVKAIAGAERVSAFASKSTPSTEVKK